MGSPAAATNLRYLRINKGWSQESAAKTAGISRSHYAMIESGKSRPGVEAAQRLGKCLGFDWQVFFASDSANRLYGGVEV